MLNKQLAGTAIMIIAALLLITGCDNPGILKKSGDKSQGLVTRRETAFKMNERLGRGVNLGGSGRLNIREEDFQAIKDAGFNSIRLPVRWSAYAQDAPPYTIEPSWFEKTDWAVKQALSRNLPIVLDFHYYPLISFVGRETTTETLEHNTKRFLGLWEQIANHYKDYPPEVLFEVMNEPSNYLGPKRWNQLQNEAISIIRRTNPSRIIVAGPECWQRVFALPNMKLPEDDNNIIVSVHCYEPLQFTHQGASYVDGAEAWVGTTWTNTSVQQHELLRDFYAMAAWGADHSRPLYLNEFGSDSIADMESRAKYTYTLTRLAEKMDMSWAYWCFEGSFFGIYDRVNEKYRKPLLEALIPPGH
jgi:endoglucanase